MTSNAARHMQQRQSSHYLTTSFKKPVKSPFSQRSLSSLLTINLGHQPNELFCLLQEEGMLIRSSFSDIMTPFIALQYKSHNQQFGFQCRHAQDP